MTLLLPTDRADAPEGGLPERLVARAGQVLARRRADRGRRGFLQRAAVVGTALAVNPFDFILRPQSAYATVCGPSNECSQGWSAFCCTINGGANTCPDGSYVAGWWKVSSSAFCRGEDRYVVDCNRLPQARCSCRCADGACDRRRVCCNNFRYGQCNQQIRGTTEVVCRIVICTPPWEWDESCTTTVRSDERTREHSSSCLNGPNPTEIAVVYQDLGLVGSALGVPVAEEAAGPGGGSWRAYTDGVIVRSPEFGIAVVVGPAGQRYAELDGPNGPLGYVTGDPVDVDGGQVLPTESGALYLTPSGAAHAITGPIEPAYAVRGGPAGWLGFPTTDVLSAPGGRSRVDFAAGWSLAHDPSTGETRLVPADVELPGAAGEWPDTAGVARWEGDTRVLTAVRISAESLPDGAPMAVLAAAGSFADALAGGVLAGIEGGPVLLTGTDALDPATADELRRLDVERVVLVGGTSALSAAVEDAVEDLGVEVERLSGDGRFATAAAVSGAIAPEGDVDRVYLTSGRDFPDALAASPAAAGDGVPLLLVEPTELPAATADELARLEPGEVVVVGGTGAVSEAVARAAAEAAGGADVRRVSGPSRFDTAAEVARELADGAVPTVLVATGEAFADALAAGAAARTVGAPLLLVGSTDTPPVTRAALEALSPELVVVAGGTAAVSATVAEQLGAIPVGDYTTRDVGQTPAPEPTDPGPEPTTPPGPAVPPGG